MNIKPAKVEFSAVFKVGPSDESHPPQLHSKMSVCIKASFGSSLQHFQQSGERTKIAWRWMDRFIIKLYLEKVQLAFEMMENFYMISDFYLKWAWFSESIFSVALKIRSTWTKKTPPLLIKWLPEARTQLIEGAMTISSRDPSRKAINLSWGLDPNEGDEDNLLKPLFLCVLNAFFDSAFGANRNVVGGWRSHYVNSIRRSIRHFSYKFL